MQPYKPTAKQVEATRMLGSARHVMLYGGSRSGKTFNIVRAIVVRALKAPKSRHAMFRLHFNQIKASIVRDTFPKVMSICFPGVPYEINRTDWFATFPNGSELWFGGLDDKDRTEKILGQEFATIGLNEVSQISFEARGTAMTRLAQKCTYVLDGKTHELPVRMYYDENPPSKGHWTYSLFVLKRDPNTRKPLDNPDDYACMRMNPEDNADNLSADYLNTLEALPARMRQRFMAGEFGDTNPNALWTLEGIDRARISGEMPDWQRIVVAVDPSGSGDTENEGNDAIGIIVAALGTDGRGYVIEDLTIKAGPATWGRVVATAFDRHAADIVVGEVNYGGAMVQHVVRTAKANIPYKSVTASRGKAIRAEPISSLSEQGKVRFVGHFPDLEDELCAFSTYGYTGDNSPNRADAFIWAMSELFPGMVQGRYEFAPLPKPQPETMYFGLNV